MIESLRGEGPEDDREMKSDDPRIGSHHFEHGDGATIFSTEQEISEERETVTDDECEKRPPESPGREHIVSLDRIRDFAFVAEEAENERLRERE